jgi:hypothetical protein
MSAPHRIEVELLHQPDVLQGRRVIWESRQVSKETAVMSAPHRVEFQLFYKPDVLQIRTCCLGVDM